MDLASATDVVKEKVGTDSGLGATLKFDFEDEGVIFVDAATVPNAVSNDDNEAQCTIRMSLDNFEKMLGGELDPTMAFMTGKLKVDGDMGIAMKLSSVI